MKNILLSSAAIVAFAGAAAAESHMGVTFSGTAELGYNTDDNPGFVGDDNEGFYSDLEITIGLAAELDNGLTAAASIDFEDLADGTGFGDAEYELSLTSETSGLYFGDTQFAAERMWVAAGDMEQDSFSEADGEEVLRGELTYGMVEAQMSYALTNNEGTRVTDDLDQLSLGVSADFGNFNVVAAYQEESDEAAGFYSGGVAPQGDNGDFNQSEIFGLSVGTAFAGADVRLAYVTNQTTDENSTGVSVTYPFGPVTGTVYYVDESNGDANYGVTLAYVNGPIAVELDYDNDQGVNKTGLEGSYDVGNGLTVYAGYLTQDSTDDRYYVAGTYDLGSGAELLVSYADDDSNVDEDEIGANEYQRGTTVQVTFEF
ncbi:porin [Thalassorhabdomicrobium marinisediminis]|uniref:Porin n=1 Tax=Thalassorhabdomicrobium marinisediminis TaxID=2170577 RepID=A0A2T7G084_9RHOB|nr:porin [Thalassorhabdomicrobium marinisediminis]PVA07820.1 porin [Thalassorhabdomicrobium marinisediminis]